MGNNRIFSTVYENLLGTGTALQQFLLAPPWGSMTTKNTNLYIMNLKALVIYKRMDGVSYHTRDRI